MRTSSINITTSTLPRFMPFCLITWSSARDMIRVDRLWCVDRYCRVSIIYCSRSHSVFAHLYSFDVVDAFPFFFKRKTYGMRDIFDTSKFVRRLSPLFSSVHTSKKKKKARKPVATSVLRLIYTRHTHGGEEEEKRRRFCILAHHVIGRRRRTFRRDAFFFLSECFSFAFHSKINELMIIHVYFF